MLIQDDFGLQPLDNGSRMHLMDIIEDRYGKKSTLITSQLPVKDRYDVIGKKTIAGAVMDTKPQELSCTESPYAKFAGRNE